MVFQHRFDVVDALIRFMSTNSYVWMSFKCINKAYSLKFVKLYRLTWVIQWYTEARRFSQKRKTFLFAVLTSVHLEIFQLFFVLKVAVATDAKKDYYSSNTSKDEINLQLWCNFSNTFVALHDLWCNHE